MSPEKRARLFLKASDRSRGTGRTAASFYNFLKLPTQGKKYVFPTLQMARAHQNDEKCHYDLYTSMESNAFEKLLSVSSGPFIFDHTCAEDIIADLASEVECLRMELLSVTTRLEQIKKILS
jgi:hypothetical protein